MQALCVTPGRPRSTRLEELPEPPIEEGSVLIAAHSCGICGTDAEIVAGDYGAAPPGQTHLILGHESLGRVLEAPLHSGYTRGDWVVGLVRRPDPVPCANCAVGEWDMCSNGRYTEHGIKGLNGFAAERYRLEPERLVKLDPELGELGVLLEPASVLAKAWAHIEFMGKRARWKPRRLLVTGAGPIGLLGALMGVQRGLEVHVFDRVTSGPKPALVQRLGAEYHTGAIADPASEVDVVLECSGAAAVIFDAIAAARPNGIACLLGVSSGGQKVPVDVGVVNRRLVLENSVIFGSVNANRAHYQQAAEALAAADSDWLAGLITRREPLARWEDALEDRPGDIKTILSFGT